MTYTGYIYKITNKINGKSYIGKTNNLRRRWNEHKWGKGGTAILNKAFKKYGVSNFEFSLVEKREFATKEELNKELSQMEIDYVAKFKTYRKGYNATIGGEGAVGHSVTEELKQRFRELKLERYKSEEARLQCGNGMRGKHHTKEVRERIREALLNRDHAIYEKMAAERVGKHRDHDMIMRGAKKRRKPVLQYDMEGNFIKEYEGIDFTNFPNTTNIGSCCKGKINSAYGFVWRYKNSDIIPIHIDVGDRSKMHTSQKILQLDKNGKVLAEYDSITKASKYTNIGRTAIGNCAHKLSKTAGGYIWVFKKDKEEVA